MFRLELFGLCAIPVPGVAGDALAVIALPGRWIPRQMLAEVRPAA